MREIFTQKPFKKTSADLALLLSSLVKIPNINSNKNTFFLKEERIQGEIAGQNFTIEYNVSGNDFQVFLIIDSGSKNQKEDLTQNFAKIITYIKEPEMLEFIDDYRKSDFKNNSSKKLDPEKSSGLKEISVSKSLTSTQWLYSLENLPNIKKDLADITIVNENITAVYIFKAGSPSYFMNGIFPNIFLFQFLFSPPPTNFLAIFHWFAVIDYLTVFLTALLLACLTSGNLQLSSHPLLKLNIKFLVFFIILLPLFALVWALVLSSITKEAGYQIGTWPKIY